MPDKPLCFYSCSFKGPISISFFAPDGIIKINGPEDLLKYSMALIEHIDSAPWFDSKLSGPNMVFISIMPPYLPHFVENIVCQRMMLNDAATGLVKAVEQEFEFVPETAMSMWPVS